MQYQQEAIKMDWGELISRIRFYFKPLLRRQQQNSWGWAWQVSFSCSSHLGEGSSHLKSLLVITPSLRMNKLPPTLSVVFWDSNS
jgi:hypothetical protein